MSRPSAISPARFAAGLLAGLLMLAFPLAQADRAGAKMRPLKTGVSYVYGNQPLEFEHVKAAGAKLTLTPLRWANVAPNNPPASWNPEDPNDPHYDWKEADTWVVNATAAGLVPMLQVRGAPAWAQNCPTPFPEDAPCKPDPAKLAAFSKAAAIRYSGNFAGLPRVRYWQGLNEPNLSIFFNPQYEGDKAASPHLYRQLINSFYAAIKAVAPSNVVIAAGLGPIAVPKYTIGPMRFTRELLCMAGRRKPRPTKGSCEGGVHFDILDIHPYTTGGPTHKGGLDDVQLGDIAKLKHLLQAADKAGRIKGNLYRKTPLWIIELSWDTAPPDPGGLPMHIASQWTAEALYRTWKAGVSHFFWYSIVDPEPEPQYAFHETLQSGLYFWDPNLAAQQPKEVLYAFRFPFVAFPERKGLLVWGRTPTSGAGRVVIEGKRGGKWRRLGKVGAGAGGMFGAVLKTGFGANKKGAVRARYVNESSVPFPMRPVGDFYQPPFGRR